VLGECFCERQRFAQAFRHCRRRFTDGRQHAVRMLVAPLRREHEKERRYRLVARDAPAFRIDTAKTELRFHVPESGGLAVQPHSARRVGHDAIAVLVRTGLLENACDRRCVRRSRLCMRLRRGRERR
jgi:hypothetical protein